MYVFFIHAFNLHKLGCVNLINFYYPCLQGGTVSVPGQKYKYNKELGNPKDLILL